MSNYIAIHVHSDASLLDGISKPNSIVKKCKSFGMTACALTDHGTLSNTVIFHKACKDAEIKPILGIEFYICNESSTIQESSNRSLSHILLLAKNLNGWKTLLRIVAESNRKEHFYYKPRFSINELCALGNKDVIAITGHPGSTLSNIIYLDSPYGITDINELNSHIHPDWKNRCVEHINKLNNVFTTFLEVQLIDSKRGPAFTILADKIRELGEELKIPCVATPDAHYINKEDANDQRVVLCSSLRTTFAKIANSDEDSGLSGFFNSDSYYIPSYDDMISFGNTVEELSNTIMVADLCENYDITRPQVPPKYPCPDGLSSEEYLRHLCREGWKKKVVEIVKAQKTKHLTNDDYGKRFEEEYRELTQAGLADYFLVAQDIINYARDKGQIIGAGRGSSAGCLILYLLNVTQIDPLEYNLLFSRFWNSARIGSMPDVDMDFEKEGREDIIKYIKNKYGEDRVGHIAIYGRMQGRSALKDVLRAHSACSAEEMNRITEFIPNEAEIIDQLQIMREADKAAGGDGEASIIEWSLENNAKHLSEWASMNESGEIVGPMAEYFKQAIRLEGTKRTQGKHASGIIIAPVPLVEICPLVRDVNSNELIIGVDMNDAEKLGLIKIDILGLSLLSKLHMTLDLLRK